MKLDHLSSPAFRKAPSGMTVSVASRLTLETQLRLALERREFVLFYQPKVNLVSGEITGAEALLRWNDPVSGLVSPNRIIPILEQTGWMHDAAAGRHRGHCFAHATS
jgi:EAL domain-containing protein (putative c-di-GMP-specific phosphodiesterase class I)